MLWKKQAGSIVLFAALAVAIGGGAAFAQDQDRKLRNVGAIYLAIENATEEDRTCGITPGDLRKSVTGPMAGRGFTVGGTAQVTFYISTITLIPERGLCVTTIWAKAYSNQLVQLEATGQRVFTAIDLWEDTSMISSNKGQHGKRVQEAVEKASRKFVADWVRDQQ